MNVTLLRVIATAVVLLLVGTATAKKEEALAVRVNRAIDGGAAHLVETQNADGSWGDRDPVHPFGRTALATYTLLHAGYGESSPPIQKGLGFLGLADGYSHPIKATSTYEAGCLLFLLNALGDKHRSNIHRISQWLVDTFDKGVGLWGYPGGVPDMSNTQYAALGLHIGRRHGFEVPDDIWKRLLQSVPLRQGETGAFRYRSDTLEGGAMTHAALVTLHLAMEGLDGKKVPKNAAVAFRKGQAWCDKEFDPARYPWGRGWRTGRYYYYIYGLERYAVLLGKKKLGGRDWYREGAEVLISRQRADGGWTRAPHETCFAILFLRKAVFSLPTKRDPGQAPIADAAGQGAAPLPPRPSADVPFLRKWLVSGPFPVKKRTDDMLFVDPFNLKKAKPRAGGRAGKQRWRVYTSPEDRVDPSVELDKSEWSAYYTAGWIHAERATEAILWAGSDDGLRVFLNGEQVFFENHHGRTRPDHYRIPVQLKAGPNRLLIGVARLRRNCGLHARLTDVQGAAITGCKTSTSASE